MNNSGRCVGALWLLRLSLFVSVRVWVVMGRLVDRFAFRPFGPIFLSILSDVNPMAKTDGSQMRTGSVAT